MKEKVILAYSGGLDTTAIIPWLKENFDYEVICVCVRLRTGQRSWTVWKREQRSHAALPSCILKTLSDEFCDDYIVPCVQAHAVYENKYLLGTSMARPADRQEDWLRLPEKKALQPSATVLPVKVTTRSVSSWASRLWLPISRSSLPGEATNGHMDSRESEIEYCKAARHPSSILRRYSATAVTVTSGTSAMKVWSWKIPANEPNYEHLLVLRRNSRKKAPDEGEYVTMTFEKGVPTVR